MPLRHLPSVLLLALLALNTPPEARAAQLRPDTVAAAPDPALARAIQDRRVLNFHYDGRPRVVEPHAYGRTSDGVPVLHGFQIGGESSRSRTSRGGGESASGGLPGWRTFRAADITGLTIGEDTFPGPRAGHVEGRPRLDPVWAELPAPAQP